jgi:hypothetical protein
MHHRDTESTENELDNRDPLTDKAIGLAIAVHRELGPGLLEAAYDIEIKAVERLLPIHQAQMLT